MTSAVALFCMFGVGVVLTLIGSLKLEIARRLGVGDAKIGAMFFTLMATSAVAVICMGVLTDLIGFKPIATGGFLLASSAVLLLTNAGSYRRALVACALMGVAAMGLNLGNTLLLSVLFDGANPPAASNFGNVFFGLGAFLTPFLAGILLKRIGYRATGLVVAAMLAIPALFAVMADFPPVAEGFSVTRAFGLLREPAILTTALALFFYVGLETSLGGWISTYAIEREFTETGANRLLAAFWISVMISRLIAAATVAPERGSLAVTLLSILAVVALFGMIRARTRTIATLSGITAGFAFGPLFPTIVGVTFMSTDPGLYGSAFGIVAAVGLLGGSTLPALIGLYAQDRGVGESMRLALASSVLLAIISTALGRF